MRQPWQEQVGALVVAHLPLTEQHRDWSTVPVTHGVELGVQAAAGASNSANAPF